MTRATMRPGADQDKAQASDASPKTARAYPHPAGAEAVDSPSGDRDHHRHRQQVAGEHPLDRRNIDRELVAERIQRNPDRRPVHLDHERVDNHHHDDPDQAPRQRFDGCRLHTGHQASSLPRAASSADRSTSANASRRGTVPAS